VKTSHWKFTVATIITAVFGLVALAAVWAYTQ